MPNIPSVVRPLVVAAILALLPAAALAQLRAQLVVSGLERPLAIVPDPISPNTLVVAQRNGLALAIVDGVVQPTPFLDLRSVVTDDGEQGLLGLVISPHDPNVIFACFSNKRDPSIPFPTLEWGDTVIARFRRSANPLVVDPATRFDLVWPPPLPGLSNFPFIYQPFDVHRGGNLVFGPDGMLYIGIGDGGGGNDALFNAQHPQSLLGKMLRIDVRVPDGSPRGYVVPADNPFLDGKPIAALGEIWAFGYRNPWRFSFDDFGTGATGAMIVADVGLDEREEIDYEPFGRGGRNYGWYIREGSIVTPGISPATPLAFSPLTNPIVDYPHSIGRSITGGYVYRGNALPSLYRGRYFFGDFFGRMFSIGLTIDGTGEARFADVLEHTSELGSPRQITTFGRGLDGELYFASFVGGSVYKIVADNTKPLPAAPSPFTATVAGSTLSLAWQPNLSLGPVLGYRIEAGSQPGVSDLAVLEMLSSSLVVPGVPNGLYHLRVRALNASGASEPSQELTVRVGCGGVMPFPTGLSAQVGAGGVVSLAWNPTAEATSYLIEAGTAPGGSELGIVPVAGTTIAGAIAPGSYFIRVRAVTPCGTSGASTEVTVQVA